MSLKLEDVKGLGKKIETIKEAGIDTVEKLANSNLEELTDLKGIGKATAEKMIENAKELLNKETKEGETELIKEEEEENEKKNPRRDQKIRREESKITREKSRRRRFHYCQNYGSNTERPNF